MKNKNVFAALILIAGVFGSVSANASFDYAKPNEAQEFKDVNEDKGGDFKNQSKISGGQKIEESDTKKPVVPFSIEIETEKFSKEMSSSQRNEACGSAPVPVPPSVWLLGSGLLGLVGVSRRKEAAR